jgi:hypothetical protein
VAASLDELLAGVTHREPLLATDAKSGATLERVVVDGRPMVLKHIHVDRDWTMRFIGDIGCCPLRVWRSGLMDVVTDRIDHTMVDAAPALGRNGWGAALLMHDRSDAMIPEGDAMLPAEVHEHFFADMAALAARFWGWVDDIGLTPLENRITFCGPASLAVEAARGWPDVVPKIADDGWRQFATRAPADVVDVVQALRDDPGPLVAAIRGTPLTFIHGDWKLGNLGVAPDGRTVLIDWALPGEGPGCYDLAWYLAVNAARMPQTKEDAIECYRGALDANGINTVGWFDAQMALSLLMGVVMFGWEKALGRDDELTWWCARARDGASYL